MAQIYNEGDLHSPSRSGSIRLIRIEAKISREPTSLLTRPCSGANLTLITHPFFVMPAKAGTQGDRYRFCGPGSPLFAGATKRENGDYLFGSHHSVQSPLEVHINGGAGGGSRCFRCFGRKLSADDVSFAAGILSHHLLRARENSKTPHYSAAVFRYSQRQSVKRRDDTILSSPVQPG
jgi:hypothetical protein